MRFAMPRIFKRAINALPDVNEHPASGQATMGVVLSILVHLGILVLWLSIQSGWLDNLLVPGVRPPPEMDIVIQTVAPPPTFAEKLSMPLEKLVDKNVESTGLKEAKAAPQSAAFTSDKNLEAGSRERPTGVGALPSVQGRKDVTKNVLSNQEMRAGSKQGGAPAAKVTATASAKKQAQKKEPGSSLPSMEELAEITGELVFRKMAADSVSAKKADSGATSKSDDASARPKTDAQKIDEMFEEGKTAGETKGGLAENGKLGVNAAKTPMGVFMKSVSRAIGLPWNQLVNSRMDSIDRGIVEVRIWITAEGRVSKVDVERSTANKQFVDLCLEAVRAAEIEPPPIEAVPLMREGLLPIPFKFNFL